MLFASSHSVFFVVYRLLLNTVINEAHFPIVFEKKTAL